MMLTENSLNRANKRGSNFKTSNDVFFRVCSGQRYYSPDLGRWLNRDPIGENGGANLLDFCRGNPVNSYDLLGLSTFALDFLLYYEKECCYEDRPDIADLRADVFNEIPNAFARKFAGAPDWVHAFAIRNVFSTDQKGADCFKGWLRQEDRELYELMFKSKPFTSGIFNPYTITGVFLDVTGGYLITKMQIKPGLIVTGVGLTLTGIGIYEAAVSSGNFRDALRLSMLYEKLDSSVSIDLLTEEFELRSRLLHGVKEYLTHEIKPWGDL